MTAGSIDSERKGLRPNHRRIMAYLSRTGESSRADLARALGLPKATIAGLVAELLDRGVLTELGLATGTGPGRPSRRVALRGPASAVGVLAAAKGRVRASVVTLTGDILATAEGALDPTAPRAAAVAATEEVLARAAAGWGSPADLTALVFGVAAPVPPAERGARRRGGPRPAAAAARRWEWIPTWLDGGFAAAVRDRVGVDTLVENDANLGALGELRFGAARDRADVVHLKFSDRSIGCGLVLGGWLLHGSTGFAGELAHVQVRENGPVCSCGGRGCLISTISTELLELAQPAYDERLTLDTVLRLAAEGDTGLRRLLVDVGRALGRPLADLCTMLNPELVVLDGSVGPAGAHIVRGLTESIDRYASPTTSEAATVRLGTLGPTAETLGAVALLRHEWSRAEQRTSG